MGLSINGYKAIVEMQFADFVSSGFNPIVNYLAKVHYRWNQQADVVVRMPTGAGVGAGPFHSQSDDMVYTYARIKSCLSGFSFGCKGLLSAQWGQILLCFLSIKRFIVRCMRMCDDCYH